MHAADTASVADTLAASAEVMGPLAEVAGSMAEAVDTTVQVMDSTGVAADTTVEVMATTAEADTTAIAETGVATTEAATITTATTMDGGHGTTATKTGAIPTALTTTVRTTIRIIVMGPMDTIDIGMGIITPEATTAPDAVGESSAFRVPLASSAYVVLPIRSALREARATIPAKSCIGKCSRRPQAFSSWTAFGKHR